MKKLVIGLLLLVTVPVAIWSGTLVWAQFVASHTASGQANTAGVTSDLSYICQPSGTTTSPICPIDTSGADETIFAANEDLVPGSVRWQKIRVTNTGSEPWDVLSVQRTWTELSDPGGTCDVVPEGVVYYYGAVQTGPSIGPGITLLGTVSGSYGPDPFGQFYDPFNDNHYGVAGSAVFTVVLGGQPPFSAHVKPGEYDDFLLGIRLPTSTPSACLNVVWQLTTTWSIQVHVP